MFKIGDKVKITDLGKSYTTYADWFYENDIPVKIAAKYAYSSRLTSLEGIYKIVASGTHIRNGKMLYAIQKEDCENNLIYLFSEDGLISANPKIDWIKVPIDTPIKVWDFLFEKADAMVRHFVGLSEDNKIKTWADGRTSYTAQFKETWPYAELIRPEDIEKYTKR